MEAGEKKEETTLSAEQRPQGRRAHIRIYTLRPCVLNCVPLLLGLHGALSIFCTSPICWGFHFSQNARANGAQ